MAIQVYDGSGNKPIDGVYENFIMYVEYYDDDFAVGEYRYHHFSSFADPPYEYREKDVYLISDNYSFKWNSLLGHWQQIERPDKA